MKLYLSVNVCILVNLKWRGRGVEGGRGVWWRGNCVFQGLGKGANEPSYDSIHFRFFIWSMKHLARFFSHKRKHSFVLLEELYHTCYEDVAKIVYW